MRITSDPFEHERLVAIRAVRAGACLCRGVAAEIAPETLAKNDKSPVTVADFGSQAVICRALAAAFPTDPIIAEEDAADLRLGENAAALGQVVRHVRAAVGADADAATAINGDDVAAWIDRGKTSQYIERFWTIDPIDGTKGFLRREQYAVALALIVNGQVVVAALACPNLAAGSGGAAQPVNAAGPAGSIFWAVRGRGAYEAPDSGTGEFDLATGWPIRVSTCDEPGRARMCESVESGHSAHGDAAAVANRLKITAPALRMDSQAKYAIVARGDAEIYLRMPTRADYQEKIWDHAAGALIVAEAGGAVTDLAGHPLEFHHGRALAANRGVVVTNGTLHARLVAALGETTAESSL